MNSLKIFSIAIILSLCTWITPYKASAQDVTVSFQVFYDNLSPYGQWENDPDYGYVWIPYVSGFVPYSTNGYWIYTDYGWTWVSNYSWGWAPFHYGRWNHRGARWVWIPDNVWGPGWVEWRNSPGYYGWTPLGYGNIDYYNDYNRWCFVSYNHFGRHDVYNYYAPRKNNVVIIKNSTVINNAGGAGGPNITEAQKQSGRTFNKVKVQSYNKPGQSLTDNQLNIYRPQVEKSAPGVSKPAKVVEPKQNAAGVGNGTVKQNPKLPPKQNTPGTTQPIPQQQKQNAAGNGAVKPSLKLTPKQKGTMQPIQQQPKQNPGGKIQAPPPQQPKQNPNGAGSVQPVPQQQPKQFPKQAPPPQNMQLPPQQQQPKFNPGGAGGLNRPQPQQQPRMNPNPGNKTGGKPGK